MTLDRRRFLASSAAAISAYALPQMAVAESKDPFGGWPIGVQSYSLRNFNLVEAVRHIQGMGLHYVEFFKRHVPMEITDQQLAETNQLLKDAGIRMNAYGVMGFSKDRAANREVFEFAKRIGIKNITANPTPDSFDHLDELVEEFGMRICIHNHGPGAIYDKIDDVEKAVERRHPNIGACVDTGHFIRSKEDPVAAVRRLGKRVFALHIKDEEKQEKQSRNVVIGTGFLDLVGLFKALREIQFPADGAISLEYEANPDNPIDDMNQCVAAARSAIAKAG